MADTPIHVGDVGLRMVIKINDNDGPFDLTVATSLELVFYSAAGRKFSVTPTAIDIGTIAYVTVAGNLDVPGTWKFQLLVHLPSSGLLYSDVGKFKVKANI